MITDDLIAYIQAQLKKDTPKDSITNKLLEAGWKSSDIEEGFANADSILESSVVFKTEKKIDPYRELTEEEEDSIAKRSLLNKKEVNEVKESKTENSLTGVWSPVKIKPVNEYSLNTPHIGPQMTASSFKEHKEEIQKVIPSNNSNPSIPEKTQVTTPIRSSVFENFSKEAVPNNWNTNNNPQSNSSPEEETSHKNKSALWMTIFLIVILIIAGAVFAFMKGYIDISNINIPFIKKDPKVLLLNNNTKLSSLNSYKTETVINISSPTFANITNGLINGEEVPSLDKDSLSIQSLSFVNNGIDSMNSQNLLTVKSSILNNTITTSIKNNESNIFISIPDLSEIMGKDAPSEEVVVFNREDINQIIPLLPSLIAEKANKVDLYDMLSEGISSYVTKGGSISYRDFVENTSIVEKEPTVIRDVETYHYDINTNKQITKKLLKDISSSFFVSTLSDEDKSKLDKVIGSLNINSFEVWIGKDDNNIYQYSIDLSIPLSKILGLEDSGIGDSEVRLDWTTTYYDFNVANEIIFPKDFINATDFIKKSNDIKLKNKINQFSYLANALKNAEGSFGKSINKSGSCVKPDNSSLFSPIGHNKASSFAVGDIATTMNNILMETNNIGFCYSNLNSWAMAFPLESEPGYYFCLDSTGVSNSITTELKGFKCN